MTTEMKQAYLDKMNAQLREWTAKVEVVKARVAKGTADVRLDYHKRIENWNERESTFKSKIEELKGATAEGYENMKSGLQKMWDEVSHLVSSIEDNKKNEKH
jgi:hypothetical protein